MTGITTGKTKLPYPDENDSFIPHEFMPPTMQAVADELSLRSRYSFDWIDGVDMAAETKMVEGSRGFRRDIRTEYVYFAGAWQLATPHAEFTGSKTVPNGTLFGLGPFTLDAANSSDQNFVTAGPDPQLIIANPGIYAISTVVQIRNPADTAPEAATSRTFMDLSFTSSTADIQRVSIQVGEDRGSLGVPNVRAIAANTKLYFEFYRTSSSANPVVRTRIRITRIA